MGMYRKFNNLIFFTIVANSLSIIILGVAVGTTHWYESTLIPDGNENGAVQVSIEVNYGLFSGSRTIVTKLGNENNQVTDLKVVCLADKKVCMYSCGLDADRRKKEISELWAGKNISEVGICDNLAAETSGIAGTRANFRAGDEDIFLNYGLWLSTLVFLFAAMGFAALSGLQALYNTYRAPIQPIFSVFGLYIWNGISAICALLGIIVWGIAFGGTLKENAAINYSIIGSYVVGSASLGYSFWIVIISELLCYVNIGILRYRTWKIQKIEEKLTVVTPDATSPNALVY